MAQHSLTISRRYASPDVVTRGYLLRLLALVVVAWLPALADRHAVSAAAELFPLAESGHAYFAPAHAWTLYVWTPIVVASACVLFLSPGLFLSLALNAANGVGEWMLTGLALSLLVVSAAAAIVQGALGSPLRDGGFAAVVVACSLAGLGLALLRVVRGGTLAWPLRGPHAGITLLSMAVVPSLILVALAPKFYWESFNGDGAHAFESARLLLVQPLPFWPASAGEIADFPGITSMLFAYPSSWFVRLFGEVEASARLPFLLYLVALYGAIVALVESGRVRPLAQSERWLIWLGLGVYAAVVAFSATYNPYLADVALPATQDTLLVACFLGFVLAFVRRARWLTYLFVALTFLSLPNGTLLIGFWLLAVVLVWRPRPWRQVAEVVGALGACLLLATIAPPVLAALRVPPPGQEYGPVGLLHHFAWLQWADWRRLAFTVVPGGILPAVGLLAWRWQSQVARALTLVTLAYFGFFYVSAHVVLHYFIPAMLLPLVVFWQNDLVSASRQRPLILASAGVAGVVALLISLPANGAPDTSGRLVGSAIDDRVGGYDTLDPAAFRGSEVLRYLFPYDWDPRVPSESYGGSPLTWLYYAHRSDGATRDANYVLQSSADLPPPGARLVAQEGGVALYVRSDAIWARHRDLRPPTPAGSPVYEIPRGIIFRSVPLKNGPPILDVVGALERSGVDVAPVLNRLGVTR